jgi:hypothetical protein
MTEPLLRGYTIFCDDIRHEIGGKVTFAGVYEGIMFVHGDFPFVLAKFGLGIRYMERRDANLTEDINIQVFMPGQSEHDTPAFGGVLPAQDARNTVQPHADAAAALETPRYLQLATNLIFSPLIIPQKGTIKVRAYVGSERVKLGSLLVTQAPQDTTLS